MTRNKRIPCHLIAGTLGVGKTTAILDYLKRHAGRQFVAVLVNDFGPIGLDGAIMEGELGPSGKDGVKISMVPGGCICCTALPGMMDALRQISQSQQADRAIIEPSGLARAGAIIDIIRSMQLEDQLELRPVITLMDPKDLDRPHFMQMPYFTHMIDAADVLVANKCDLAGDEQIARFKDLAERLYPPKLRVLTTDHGRLPDELFQLTLSEKAPSVLRAVLAPGEGHQAHEHHEHGETNHTGGLLLEAELQFDYRKVRDWFKAMADEGFAGIKLERLKAVLNTESGWYLFEIAADRAHQRPSQYRRDNRMDWITDGGKLSTDEFTAALMAQRRS